MAIDPNPVAAHCKFDFAQDAGPRASGWSMNFWNSGANLTIALQAARNLAPLLQAVVGAKAILQRYGARLVYQPGAKGVRSSASVFNVKPGGPPKQEQPDADYPTTAVVMELRTAVGQVVRQTIRAIPDDDTTLGGWYTPGPTSTKATEALLTALGTGTNGWVLVIQNGGKTPKSIQAMSTITGLVGCIGHGFDPGDIIKIGGRRIGGTHRLNGTWKVLKVDSVDSFTLQGWEPTAEDESLNLASAYAQQKAFVTAPIFYDRTKPLTSQLTFVTEHKVGRPRELLSGRRKRLA